MKENLVLVANATHVKIYSTKFFTEKSELHFLKEFDHPESKLKNRDLVSDKPGHYKNTATTTRGAYENPDHKALEAERFAKEIADWLKHEKSLHHYVDLFLFLPEHFHGLLRQHLDKFVLQSIKKVIHKDIVNINNEKELLQLVHEHMSL